MKRAFAAATALAAALAACAQMQHPPGDGAAAVTRLTWSGGARNGQPFFSPDGSLISHVSNQSGDWQVWTMRADGSDRRQLSASATGLAGWPSWRPDGGGLFYYDGAGEGFAIFSLELNGETNQLAIAPTDADYYFFRPSLSPDGETLLFDRQGGAMPNHDLFTYSARARELTQLTFDPGYDADARWSPDGAAIVWHSDRGAGDHHTQIFIMCANGREMRQLTFGPARNAYPAWSPDGGHIVYTSETNGSATRDIWVMDANGANPVRVTRHAGFDGDPIWTPDGTTIVFATDRFGGRELARIPAPTPVHAARVAQPRCLG